MIAFEGIDRAGKDAARKVFGQISGERYLAMGRFLFSQAVYDMVFGRSGGDRPTTQEYMRLVERFEREFDMLTVFVDTPPGVAALRAEGEIGGDRHSLRNLAMHRELFVDLIGESNAHRLVIKPGEMPPDQIAHLCWDWAKMMWGVRDE